jgi:hypothetical protein
MSPIRLVTSATSIGRWRHGRYDNPALLDGSAWDEFAAAISASVTS